MDTTSRLGLSKPVEGDAVTALRESIGDNADTLDTVALDDQGALASRPVSTAPLPGKAGRYYKATDTGRLARDHGTGWEEVVINPPAARAVSGSSQNVTTGPSQISLGTERFDLPDDDQHSTSLHSGRFICQRDGIYAVSAFCRITSTGGGAPHAEVNAITGAGVEALGSAALAAGATLAANFSSLVALTVGDYVEFLAQNVGGGGSVSVQSGASMGWHYVRALVP